MIAGETLALATHGINSHLSCKVLSASSECNLWEVSSDCPSMVISINTGKHPFISIILFSFADRLRDAAVVIGSVVRPATDVRVEVHGLSGEETPDEESLCLNVVV